MSPQDITINIAGTIDRVLFRSGESGYAAMKLRPDGEAKVPYTLKGADGMVAIVGTLSELGVGQRLSVTGKVIDHRRFGPQIRVESMVMLEPKDISDIVIYLTKNVKSVGPHYAKKIVAAWGMDTFTVLDATPERLYEIKGIDQVRAEGIRTAWGELKSLRDLLLFATQMGIGHAYIARIHKSYGDSAIELIRADPYRLARDIEGIGFAKADEIAMNMNVPEVSDIRIRAAALYLLEQSAQANGDCYLFRHDLITQTAEFLNNVQINVNMVADVVSKAADLKIVIDDEGRVYPPDLHRAERDAASRLLAILTDQLPPALIGQDLEKAITKALSSAGLELHPVQIEAIDRTMRNKVSVITGGPGVGKCLGKGTPVLMHDGVVKKVEEIQVGDLLMGPDSQPRQVLSLARGREMMYRVTPTKGDPYEVNESHILSLKMSRSEKKTTRRHKGGEVVNLSVREYLQKSHRFKHHAKGWRTGVDFASRPVPIDPYFLGLWLGDGSSHDTAVTSCDEEILEFLHNYAGTLGLGVGNSTEKHPLKAPIMRITSGQHGWGSRRGENSLLKAMRDLGIIHNKHLPHIYKANDRQVRLEVLAGLLDSDGSLCENNCFDFVSALRVLAEDVAFLARSLGLAAYVKPCRKSCQTGATGQYYRVCISGDIAAVPTRLPRKVAATRCQKKNVLVTGIQVEPIGEGNYYGFEIDGDRLFLLGDFTVTHNTTITRAIVAGYDAAEVPLTLLAPTGKAAKRMTEVIGRQAHTIHRRLWSLNKDVKDGSVELEDAQLRGVVIVDEVSMVDIKTLAWLLSFVHPSAVLVFVGDADQLPSVGPGSVLRDLLNTPSMAATRLTQIFRQAAASDIVRHAHAINQGMTPPIERLSGEIVRARGWPKTDFFLIEEEDQTKMADKAVWAATHMAPRLGFDPLVDVQVLTPMKRGDAGVGNLNRVLQGALNPSPGDSIKRFDQATWGVGDRLMQLKNNYDYDIYNGDQGRIVRFTRKQDDSDPTHLVLDVDGREVEIEREDFHQLTLAYAATVHKSQGSEFPFVVICLHTSHFTLLQRNLLYTGVTRGKKCVVLIAHPQALSMAVANNKVSRRNTYLTQRLTPYQKAA